MDYISTFLEGFKKKTGNQLNHLPVDQNSNSSCRQDKAGMLTDVSCHF
jgi:hypothetical protein